MQSTDQHEQVIRQYVNAFNAGDLESLQALFADDARIQGVLGWEKLEVFRPVWHALHYSLAAELTIESMVAQGDYVALRYTERGACIAVTPDHVSTQAQYKLSALELFEFAAGRIARKWHATHSASQARQVGLSIS